MSAEPAKPAAFGPWRPATIKPDTWRLVAWAYTGTAEYPGGFACGYYVSGDTWQRYDGNKHCPPNYWCDFPPAPVVPKPVS